MIHKLDYDLYCQNTMRLHSIANEYFEPESVNELRELIIELKKSNKKYYILGGGSNILMPPIIDRPVLSMKSLNCEFSINDGIVKAGASLKIQSFIRELQKEKLGGIEYLFSLPCQLGGAIYMNAGRGGIKGKSISDYVVTVNAFNPETLECITINKENCHFSHRYSDFQKNNLIILSASFRFDYKSHDDVEIAIKERLDYSIKHLDPGKPSCGSVFNISSGYIMKLLRKLGIRIGGAMYSKKTMNWISNVDNATYSDVEKLINIGILLHKLTFQNYNVEIIKWE